MKQFLTALFILIGFNSFATNYYVKIGGNNSLSGTSDVNAWADLTKVNATTFVNGDIISFRCGDTFYGTIIPNTSGVTYNSYIISSTAKPIITGLTTISSWVNIGGNIWEAVVPSGLSTLNMVVLNGRPIAMGRFPNTGYNTITSNVTNVSITDATLPGTPNFTGGEAIIRINSFDTRRFPITNQTGGTLTVTGTSTYSNGFGYFIQNHILTLDQQNEWYYADSAGVKLLKMFSIGTPPTVQVATKQSLVSMQYSGGAGIRANITFNGISFVGCNGRIADLLFANNETFSNCDLIQGGSDAIYYQYSIAINVIGCTITDCLNTGIYEYGGSIGGITNFTNNTVKRIGIFAGMITPLVSPTYVGGSTSCGVTPAFAGSIITGNTFDSTGYNSINLRTLVEGDIVRRNFITHYCFVKNDGGGIYNSGLRGGAQFTIPCTIDSNIIGINGNASVGTGSLSNNIHARAIYCDATSYGLNILHNTVYDAWEGIYISQAQRIRITGNTIWNTGLYSPSTNQYAGSISTSSGIVGYTKTKTNIITSNVLFNKINTQLGFNIGDGSTPAYIDSIGVIDSNYYINTSTNAHLIFTNTTSSSTLTTYSLVSWKAAFPIYDVHSVTTPLTTPVLTTANADSYLRFDYNASITPLKINFNGLRYMDVNGGLHDNADTIAAWSSRGLILVGSVPPVNQPPVANAGADQSITLPTNSTSVTGSATDADGTVVSTQWVKISGPTTGTIATPTTLTSAVNSLVQGTYLLQFSATDNLGAIGRDTMQITVNPAPVNQLPIVSAGVDKNITLPTNTVSVTGTASDPDGSIVSVLWAFVSGPATATFGSATSLTTAINSLTVAGTYVISFTATDNSGGSSSDFMQVFVAAANIAPTANAGVDQSITLPVTTATLTGSGNDIDGTIVGYQWVKLSGPAGTITSPTSATTGLTGLTIAGNYLFQLTVTDNNGATASDVMQLTVLPVVPPPNIPPTANAGSPVSITLPTNFTVLNGSASIDPDGVIVSYRWSKVSGGVAVIVSPTSAITNVTSMVAGIYQFRLAVIDNLGDSGIATVQVTVQAANIPPSVNAGNDTTIVLPTNIVHLSATVSDLDGTITSVLWTKISGTGGTIVIPNSVSTDVISLTAGTYLYQITAKDNAGDSSSDVVQITVLPQPANVPPTATITGGNQLVLLPSTTTTLSGYGTDTDGYIFSYAWTLVSSPVGSSPIIQTPTAPTTGILNLSYIGDYVFMLTVTDNRGGQGAATVTVSVIQTTADGTIISGKTKYIN